MINRKIYIAFLGCLFLFSRIYLIEKDIPPIDVSGYAQIDEAYYATLALDKLDFGSFFYNKNGLIELTFYIFRKLVSVKYS